MNYYNEIKTKLIENEIHIKIKNYSKERNTILTYFEIGKLLSKANNKYGDNIIEKYSQKLMLEVGKKYNKRTLYRMKQLYTKFNNTNVSPLVTQLTWTHYLLFIPIKKYEEIEYYANQCIKLNLSKRELETKIKNKEYERLDEKTKNKIINDKPTTLIDNVKNPLLIHNRNNYNLISEKVLQKIILEDIPTFLEELGDGFSFIKNEYKIKIENTYNYIDLLLYNINYNCYVIIELKITELKKEHIGQIQVYMNYIDNNLRTINQDKTIGIIICKKDNKYIIEYCSDPRIISREYKIE